MIPQSFIPETGDTLPPDESWRLKEETISSDRVAGLEAVRQAVYLALNTERYQYPIYSWDYGAELADLFGQPASFVRPELERRIRDALSQDERITGIGGFAFETRGKTLCCSFTVNTIYGDFAGDAYPGVPLG
jgi:hypothetical protein